MDTWFGMTIPLDRVMLILSLSIVIRLLVSLNNYFVEIVVD